MIILETGLPDQGPQRMPQKVILVVDDEVLVRNIVTILLQRQGYIVVSAADGQEGLELSRKYPDTIDLVITDVEMPRLNGMDLIAHLRGERPGIKVLVMSGAETNDIASRNANLPFLPKPFDGEALLSRVRALLGVAVESHKAVNVPGGSRSARSAFI